MVTTTSQTSTVLILNTGSFMQIGDTLKKCSNVFAGQPVSQSCLQTRLTPQTTAANTADCCNNGRTARPTTERHIPLLFLTFLDMFHWNDAACRGGDVHKMTRPAWLLTPTEIPSISKFYEKAPSLTQAKITRITFCLESNRYTRRTSSSSCYICSEVKLFFFPVNLPYF